MILIDEPMRKHTTFGVGGPADVFVAPDSVDEVVATVRACRKLNVPYFVLKPAGERRRLSRCDSGAR